MAITFSPGLITRQQTVWCWYSRSFGSREAKLLDRYRPKSAECEQHHIEDGPVAAVARAAGWKKIGRYGYTCPTCQRAMNCVPAGAWLSTIEEGDNQ